MESLSVSIPATYRDVEVERKKETASELGLEARNSVDQRQPKLSRTFDQRDYHRFIMERDHKLLV